ncbi:MAG: hypothetical protein WD767_04980 [Alphaproteobacteria bacterium]
MATVGTFNGNAQTRRQEKGAAVATDNAALVQFAIDSQFSIPLSRRRGAYEAMFLFIRSFTDLIIIQLGDVPVAVKKISGQPFGPGRQAGHEPRLMVAPDKSS